MGIVNFDNLVMEVGMKAMAFANKHRTHYAVKRKERKRGGGEAPSPDVNAVRNSYSIYLTFQ